MGQFKNLDEIKQAVEASQHVLTLSMEELRDAYGAGRLGEHVRANISKKLNGLGLGHVPEDLPKNYWDPIRVYKLGSKVADLIDAVLKPSKEHDDEIRQALGGEKAELMDVLDRIRELVCK